MRFIHLADLHIGRKLNEFSLLEDQRYILEEILKIISEQKPDAVLIAGDIYDKSIPPTEAVSIFDDFLVKLSKENIEVFVISGNHDSPERMAFGARLMSSSGVHISPAYDGVIESIRLSDEYGEINIYMLPFVKPAHVRVHFPEAQIDGYTSALRTIIEDLNIDSTSRNILMAHQFVTGAQRSDSEEISVGGLDNVNADVFDDFDYVALGHIHRAQSVGRKGIRYCGTPLKYSFSELNHEKSVTIVDMGAKGELEIHTIALTPLRDLKHITGEYMQLSSKGYYQDLNLQDYYHITLTDEEDIPDVLNKLRIIYKNIMKLDYDNKRTRENASIEGLTSIEHRTPLDLVSELYQLQNNQELSKEQRNYLENLIEGIWEEEL